MKNNTMKIICLKIVVHVISILSFINGDTELDSEIHSLDKFIRTTIECRKIPALSISLVRDGHVIMSRGYGHKDIENEVKATEHSKFCIGSLTKAFTATVIADVLSKQNRITLDTPIKDILGPCFRLSTDLLSNEVNLRDLLAHKVGTPPYFHALVVGFPENTTRSELVRRLQYMPATKPFRTNFKYSNYMYTLAGYIAEVISKEPWSKLVTERLLEPLGMRSTGMIGELDGLQDIVTPYTLKHGRLMPIDKTLIKNESGCYKVELGPEDIKTAVICKTMLVGVKCVAIWLMSVSPSDPAGAVYSSASDMAKWMLFHLNYGRNAHGRRLVDDIWLYQTYESQMSMPFSGKDVYKPTYPVADLSISYDLGWMTSVYRGYRKIWHSGGIVAYQSLLWLFPDKRSGVFVVISGPFTSQGSLAMRAITSRAADMVLREEPWLNLTTTCTLPEPWTRKTVKLQPKPDYITFKWNISRSQQDYAGVYGHRGFGNLTVYSDNTSSLYMRFGRFGKMHLQPISDTRFSGYYVDKLWFFTASDEHNVPITMEFNIDMQTDSVKSVWFPVDFREVQTLFVKDLYFDWNYGDGEQSTSDTYCRTGRTSGASVSNTDSYKIHVLIIWSLVHCLLQN